jgi:N-methylhydantoinase B
MVCDPERPNNEGTYRPLTVTAPEGCLVNPAYPAACFWRLAAGMLVSELMFRILAEIAPDRVPADSGSMPTWQFYVNGVKKDGAAFALHQHAFGGMGGRPGMDGLASVSFPYNVRDVSVEWAELETPIRFERRELIADSGGAGRWRGGLGEELAFSAFDDGRLDPDTPVVLSGSAGRMRFAPEGLFGGRPGSRGRIRQRRRDHPDQLAQHRLSRGEVVRLLLPGGGGYGDPRQRERAVVADDLRNALVTPDAARREYGYDSDSDGPVTTPPLSSLQ